MRQLLICAFCLLLGGSTLNGQTGQGQIQGTVSDATGAVIPQATVELDNAQNGSKLQAQTTAVGFFVFPSLQAGSYRLTVSAAGMNKWQGEIALEVGQTAEITPHLTVASGTNTVTVLGDVTPVLTTTSPTIATVVERTRIEQLPMNGRAITTLIQTTTPGLENSATQPQVYGLRDSTMEFVQDGVPLDSRNTGDIQARPPGVDTVQEFRIETSVSSAKLDRPANAIMSTRSGTNQVHGSAFETGRNSGFGVARQRQDSFTTPPHLVRNEFGASMGAPIFIPKVYDGHNKTFFFFGWEESRLRSASTGSAYVWPAADRVGDFSGLTDASGKHITIYDPLSVGPGPTYTKTPFINNQIPLSRMSPLAKYMYSVTPLPTSPGVNPNVAANWFGTSPLNQDTRTFTTRIDHKFNDSNHIYGRYSYGLNNQMDRRAFNTNGNPITSDGLWQKETYYELSNTMLVSFTHLFSPTFFVQSEATWTRINWQYSENQPNASQNISAMLGTPNPFNVGGAPYIYNFGYGTPQTFAGVVPRTALTKIYSGEQNFTKAIKNHQLEFGWRYRQEYLDTVPDHPDQSDVYFDSNATSVYDPSTGAAWGALPYTGANTANFFLGDAENYSQARPPRNFDMHGKDEALYIQDNWKVSSNLALNFGVRWEYLGPYTDSKGLTETFDFKNMALVDNVSTSQLVATDYTTAPIVAAYANAGVKWETPSQANLSSDFIKGNKHDFAPRAGFAYHTRVLGKNFVMRGGYGLYHFPVPARTFSELRLDPPFQGSYSLNFNSSANSPDGQANYFLRAAPPIIAGLNSGNNVLNINNPPNVNPGITITALNTDLPSSMAHQWNYTMEMEVMKDTVARVSWIGTAGRNIEAMQILNQNPVSNYVWYVTSGQPLPSGFYANTVRRPLNQTIYGDFHIYSKIGWSNYEGIQLEAERHFSKGLAFQAFYLMSNAMDTGATPSQGGDFTVDSLTQPGIYLPGAVPQDPDARYRFLRYQRDPNIAHHRIRWNFVYDLPVGKGQRLLSGARGLVNELVGGWQLAGSGTTASRWVTLGASNFGPTAPAQIYGTQYKVSDCRSGACLPAILYFNGYIQANQINTGKGGVNGVPTNYVPLQQPVNPTPANGGDPNFKYYETNNVFVPLANGTQQLVAYDNGLNWLRNQLVKGPWLTSMNASLYKMFPIKERMTLRLNLDAFNVFNQPGLPLPNGTTGLIDMRSSGQGARVLQYTLRLAW
jgi:hypothetical protein